ncbi:MAG: response regulator [Verrucomicrobiota bacterium JB024]|nr:response regulator [Verrucomicrobiota bacterium JB024]
MPDSFHPQTHTILIVEDDPGTRQLIGMRLKRRGMNILTAGSGREAIEQLEHASETIGLVLLDYRLVDTNAEKLIKEHWARLGNPAFIVLTGFGDERVAVKLMKLGAEDYIVKDKDFHELLTEAVDRTLQHLDSQRRVEIMEKQLRESEERLALALNVAGVAVWDVDVEKNTAIVCERWCRLIGQSYPPGPVPLEVLHDHVYSEDREKIHAGWAHFLRQPEKLYDETYRIRDIQGNLHWVHDQGIVVQKDADGTVQRVIRAINDVSESKRIQELELQMLRAQRMETLGTLASGIAHDFNNVLAAILGFTELTMRWADRPKDVVENCGRVIMASQRAKEVIRQILLFCRDTPPQKKPHDLRAIADEFIEMSKGSLPDSITVKRDYRVEQAVVDADAGLLGQVVTNLLTNAAQAMPDRTGTILVRVDTFRDLDVDISDQVPDHVAPASGYVLEIHDDGSGIDPKSLGHIFEPFYSTKAQTQGTGLGLATAQGIVHSHDGIIRVESELGKGTCFRVFLPAGKVASQGAQPSEQAAISCKKGRRILFVDDQHLLAEANSRLLVECGYEVTTFNNPQHALEHFKNQDSGYEQVISDYSMPQLTGVQLLRELTQIRPQLKCILITGNLETNSNVLDELPEQTVVLRKPYSLNQLLEVIENQQSSAPGVSCIRDVSF